MTTANPVREMLADRPARLQGATWITHPAWARCGRGWADSESTAVPAALPVMLRTVAIARPVRRARWWVTGLGTWLATVDGRRVDDAVLEPGYADTARRVAARCLDVSHLLAPGSIELAVELGTGVTWLADAPGRYAKFEARTAVPQLLARLEIEYADHGTEVVVTDAGWRSRLGSTTTAHWHGGEDYDARRAAAPEATVAAALLAAAVDGPELWWRRGEPVMVVAELPVARADAVALPPQAGAPQREPEPEPGIAVVLDAGVNIAGRYVLHLARTTSGQRVVIRPAELLNRAGTVEQYTTGTPIWDSVTCDGGPLTWHPRHVYHGFRYLQIEGLDPAQRAVFTGDTGDIGHAGDFDDTDDTDDTDATGDTDDTGAPGTGVTVQVMRAGARTAGSFTCSDPVFEGVHTIIDRAVQSNMYSVFTDCPHREKLGWLEEVDLCFDVLTRGYDVTGLLRDTLVHIRDAQDPGGLVPSIAPELVHFGDPEQHGEGPFRDDPNWGSILVQLPWQLYRLTGDDAELQLSWPAIVRYLGHLARRVDARGLLDHGLGDWVAVDDSTPRGLVATCGYLRTVVTAARVARVVGRQTRSADLAELAQRLRAAIRRRFRDPLSGLWGSGSQASWALALDCGAVTPADRPAAGRGLLAAVASAGTTLTVGEIALPAVLRALADLGRDDVISALVRNREPPGCAHLLTAGVTALPESLMPPVPGGPSSQNHFMLATIDSWLTGRVAGLAQDPTSAGWARALVRPVRVAGVEWARTTYDSPRGRYAVHWDATGVEVRVPEGGAATVVLPGGLSGGGERRCAVVSGTSLVPW